MWQMRLPSFPMMGRDPKPRQPQPLAPRCVALPLQARRLALRLWRLPLSPQLPLPPSQCLRTEKTAYSLPSRA